MKSSLAGIASLAIAMVATAGIFSATSAAETAEYAFAVKAPPGLTFMVSVQTGSKSKNTNLAKVMNLSERDADGFYTFTAPASLDPTKVRRWCATVVNPAKYVENAVCTAWGKMKVPADGRYELTLPELKVFTFGG